MVANNNIDKIQVDRAGEALRTEQDLRNTLNNFDNTVQAVKSGKSTGDALLDTEIQTIKESAGSPEDYRDDPRYLSAAQHAARTGSRVEVDKASRQVTAEMRQRQAQAKLAVVDALKDFRRTKLDRLASARTRSDSLVSRLAARLESKEKQAEKDAEVIALNYIKNGSNNVNDLNQQEIDSLAETAGITPEKMAIILEKQQQDQDADTLTEWRKLGLPDHEFHNLNEEGDYDGIQRIIGNERARQQRLTDRSRIADIATKEKSLLEDEASEELIATFGKTNAKVVANLVTSESQALQQQIDFTPETGLLVLQEYAKLDDKKKEILFANYKEEGDNLDFIISFINNYISNPETYQRDIVNSVFSREEFDKYLQTKYTDEGYSAFQAIPLTTEARESVDNILNIKQAIDRIDLTEDSNIFTKLLTDIREVENIKTGGVVDKARGLVDKTNLFQFDASKHKGLVDLNKFNLNKPGVSSVGFNNKMEEEEIKELLGL